MNMGTINLLGTMIARAYKSGTGASELRIQNIRLRRMSLAMLRGFCCLPMWAPTSITIAVVLAGLPELTWFDLLPGGCLGAAIFMGLGWALDFMSYQRPNIPPAQTEAPNAIATFLPMLVLVVAIPVCGYVVSHLLALRLIGATLIFVPFFGMGWIFIQYLRAGGIRAGYFTGARIRKRTIPELTDIRSEIGLFASAGFLGVLLLPQIDTVALGQFIADTGVTEGPVLVLSCWVIAGLSLIGVSPIITVTLLIETLPKLAGLSFEPTVLAFACCMIWSISVGFSPIVASTRLLARCIDRSASEIGYRWNGAFNLVALCLLSGALLCVA